jgi:hypothetical protein
VRLDDSARPLHALPVLVVAAASTALPAAGTSIRLPQPPPPRQFTVPLTQIHPIIKNMLH